MISKRTVFILGAGASRPYGYPTGSELRKNISKTFINNLEKNLSKNTDNQTELQSLLQKYKEMALEFRNSSTASIDKWVVLNPALSVYAIRAIAYEILLAEQNSRFREDSFTPQEDWYSFLYNRLIEGLNDPESYQISENKVHFISFNYDRSLEHFLFESLVSSFGSVKPHLIKEELLKMGIYHVYGRLSPMPWENGIKGTNYPSGPNNFIDEASNLNVMYVDREKDKDLLADAKTALMHAEEVYFLGFGYAKENIERLDIPNIWRDGQKVFGSAYNMLEAERLRAEKLIHRNGIGMKTKLVDGDCLTVLRSFLE